MMNLRTYTLTRFFVSVSSFLALLSGIVAAPGGNITELLSWCLFAVLAGFVISCPALDREISSQNFYDGKVEVPELGKKRAVFMIWFPVILASSGIIAVGSGSITADQVTWMLVAISYQVGHQMPRITRTLARKK